MVAIALNLASEGSSNDGQKNSSLKGKKIFVLEDDVFLGNIISQRIASEGADLRLFKSGEEVLPVIEKEVPDIVLLDVLLPGMDGFKVLETIRSNEKIKKIPVLIVSNTSQLENKEKAKNLGAEFLLKALVTPHEIVEQVKKMLKK